ncbi:hypothetical protein [Streptomyces oceani]|uniref:hypothetical protein n=1 Tax=Streptomyces oceani TaxID=1075402 RepID=UPI001FCCE09A|nr:hypothetical protein [Streptomyces oceani]
MPTLTREEQRQELARLRDQGRTEGNASRTRLEGGVHRLSAGRPLVVTRLGTATSALRPAGNTVDWDLLSAPIRAEAADATERPTERPAVAEVLLDELLVNQLPEELPAEHHSGWLDTLSHLSVAHDVECAQVLMRRRQAEEDERLSAYRIEELLWDSGWPPCPRHFIGDLGLRQLLMRRLYRLQSEGTCWHADHEWLREHYAALDSGTPDPLFGTAAAHAMHHHLASLGAEAVVDYLYRSFALRDTREWCDELLAIAEAPALEPADDRRARALGAIQLSGDPQQRRVDRLLHVVRLCEDRTQAVDEAVIGTLRQLLERLSDESARGAETLTRLARDWTERAGERQPLRPCACTRHIG